MSLVDRYFSSKDDVTGYEKYRRLIVAVTILLSVPVLAAMLYLWMSMSSV